ncbi:hypothetical protein VIM7927_04468 [Vibrio mangrovi]|uniref:Uncharacterized protein n=1 Tax=Vibrio mangrovi TaxID=474394 RepID=A0A1Y6IZP1_9VIBR|nr:hypothetical protein VIM7927_04468 [Vibrio mangrovi]
MLRLTDPVLAQAAHVVILEVTGQRALCPAAFQTTHLILVLGQAMSVQADLMQTTVLKLIINLLAVRQQVRCQMPHRIVAVTGTRPALMFNRQPAQHIIFIRQRPLAVINTGQMAQ